MAGIDVDVRLRSGGTVGLRVHIPVDSWHKLTDEDVEFILELLRALHDYPRLADDTEGETT
jgi:hypothetical protein